MNEHNRREEILHEVKSLISFKEFDLLTNYIEELHYADIAEIMDDLTAQEKNIVFERLSIEIISEIFEELEADVFSDLLKDLDESKKRLILDEMAKDDIVDKLEELPNERIIEILKFMDIEDSKIIKKLLAYEPDVAGGIMTSDFVVLEETITKVEARVLKK